MTSEDSADAGVPGFVTTTGRFARSHAIVLACLALSGILIAPLFMVSVPPFTDLYFHMARMKILAEPHAPYLSEWFRPDWALVPNLAMDLFVTRLAGLTGILEATRLFYALAFLLTTTGTVALSYAIHRRLLWWPLVGSLFVYNWIVFFGFANFIFSIGLMLWVMAAWFACGEARLPLRVAVGAAGALLLYVCHLFPVGMFGLVVAGSEIELLRRKPQRRRADYLRALAAVTLPFVPPLLLLLTSHTVSEMDELFVYLLKWKPYVLFSLTLSINLPIDVLVTAGLVAVVAVLVRTHALHVSRRFRLALIVTVFLAIFMPNGLIGTLFTDTRLPVCAIFVAVAASRFEDRVGPVFQAKIAAALLALFALRMAGIYVDFREIDREEAAIIPQFKAMEPGSVVLTGSLERKAWMNPWDRGRNWQPLWRRANVLPLIHFDTLAVVFQPVFVPETMMQAGQQPVHMLSPYVALKKLDQPRGGDNARWLADQDELVGWLGEIRAMLQQPQYRFTRVYVTLEDPRDAATPPEGVVELFHGYDYRIWDVTDLVAS